MTLLPRPPALVVVVALAVLLPRTVMAQARYSTEATGDIVQLRDRAADVSVSVMTPLGTAYEIVVKGHHILQTRFTSADQFRANPGLAGVPLLAPWANRLDEMAFYANGRKYNFDADLGNVRGPIPIHGLIRGGAGWTLIEANADAGSAWVTSRLDFFRNPQYMAQFPFAHTITVTYRVSDGVVEVRTRLDNLSDEPMPVAIGYHPSYWLTDSVRDEWILSVGARTRWLLSESKLPTGKTEPITNYFPDPRRVPLKDYVLDDVFGDLERDAEGRAVLTVRGKRQQLDVLLGPNFKAAVLWSTRPTAPADRGYIAFEPMAAITNAMNMAHKGTYGELQSIPPRGHWEESFWIRPSGF